MSWIIINIHHILLYAERNHKAWLNVFMEYCYRCYSEIRILTLLLSYEAIWSCWYGKIPNQWIWRMDDVLSNL